MYKGLTCDEIVIRESNSIYHFIDGQNKISEKFSSFEEALLFVKNKYSEHLCNALKNNIIFFDGCLNAHIFVDMNEELYESQLQQVSKMPSPIKDLCTKHIESSRLLPALCPPDWNPPKFDKCKRYSVLKWFINETNQTIGFTVLKEGETPAFKLKISKPFCDMITAKYSFSYDIIIEKINEKEASAYMNALTVEHNYSGGFAITKDPHDAICRINEYEILNIDNPLFISDIGFFDSYFPDISSLISYDNIDDCHDMYVGIFPIHKVYLKNALGDKYGIAKEKAIENARIRIENWAIKKHNQLSWRKEKKMPKFIDVVAIERFYANAYDIYKWKKAGKKVILIDDIILDKA